MFIFVFIKCKNSIKELTSSIRVPSFLSIDTLEIADMTSIFDNTNHDVRIGYTLIHWQTIYGYHWVILWMNYQGWHFYVLHFIHATTFIIVLSCCFKLWVNMQSKLIVIFFPSYRFSYLLQIYIKFLLHLLQYFLLLFWRIVSY